MGTCKEHGEMRGREFVDGYKNGVRFGEYRAFCIPCRDREDAARYPYRDDPKGRRLRQARLDANLSLREAGFLLGVDFMLINDVQMGKVAPPDDATFAAWLATLKGMKR